MNTAGANPIKYNYFEGYIFIDNNYDKIKIGRKNEKKYIGIFLNEIMDIKLSKQMENIIKIYDLYLQEKNDYSEDSFEDNFDENDFINGEEIKSIRMQKTEKLMAIKNTYFIFSIVMGKKFIPKVEFIFVNYDHFNLYLYLK